MYKQTTLISALTIGFEVQAFGKSDCTADFNQQCSLALANS
uniref:Uncharacterized protein n=1 Tax=Arundo donax TaxID=35708 RepID=A0A0A8YJ52_ARUDO